MTRTTALVLFTLLGLLFAVAAHADSLTVTKNLPRTLALSGEVLAKSRDRIILREPEALAAWETLRKRAETALRTPVETITAKPVPIPGADFHDYVSLAPYWWPDPKMPGGLPYVRRDGERNPEAGSPDYDAHRLATMARTVETLALAYYFSGDERYADRAALHLRAWFLDRDTRMNPNMAHAQLRRTMDPAKDAGTPAGLIEAHHLIRVVDAARLLAPSYAWTDRDEDRLQAWFRDLADWMIASPQGKAEDRTMNNHATWYDAQLVVYLLYADRAPVARTIALSFPQRRLRFQIAEDGAQPEEAARTRPRHYVFFNLQGLFTLASAVQTMGLDLWQAQIFGEPSLRLALDRAAPYLDPATPWPTSETGSFDPWRYVPLFRRAALVYKDDQYLDRLKFLPADELAGDPGNLFY